ncbi:MAG TPA: RHS repeat-associated core domain-containing protein [Thermoanaerobaculia bacterium]|nr:RHS repeat-associated core domain-containing protein [Thermoanaerobaculia bacterium]
MLFSASVALAEKARIGGEVPLPQFVMVLNGGSEPEPELARYQATEESRWSGRVYIRISDEQARELSKHPRVHYLQAILKPQETTAYASLKNAPDRMSTDSVTDPAWNSGSYRYDGAGNIVRVGTDSYVYDQYSRITRATLTGTSSRDEYKYDSFGNLVERGTSRFGGWSILQIPVSGSNNQVVTATYDGVGNQRSGGSLAYVYKYDPFNMVAEQQGGGRQDEYVYDANDERIGTLNNAQNRWTWTVRDPGGSVARVYESPNAQWGWYWVEDFVRGASGAIGSERASVEGGRRHFHRDHLGTVRMVTNQSGQALSRHDYTPFGVEITSIHQEMDRGYHRPNVMVFTGHERDFNGWPWGEEYLDYMHARYYRAIDGRFLSVDPVLDAKRSIMNPQLWNRYAYVANNPLNRIDPDGRVVRVTDKVQSGISPSL